VRDPVVGELQVRYPGLRLVLFYSPYEAAAWAIIGHRIRIVQAAKIKARMAEELGRVVEVDGKEEHAFLGPSSLLELGSFPGLSERKVGTCAPWPALPSRAGSKPLTCGRCPPRRRSPG